MPKWFIQNLVSTIQVSFPTGEPYQNSILGYFLRICTSLLQKHSDSWRFAISASEASISAYRSSNVSLIHGSLVPTVAYPSKTCFPFSLVQIFPFLHMKSSFPIDATSSNGTSGKCFFFDIKNFSAAAKAFR